MIFLQNCSPYHVLHSCVWNYTDLRPFGCIFYVHIDSSLKNKSANRTVQCKFIEYAKDYKEYQCYDPSTGKIHICQDVMFDELNFNYKQTSLVASSNLYDPWHELILVIWFLSIHGSIIKGHYTWCSCWQLSTTDYHHKYNIHFWLCKSILWVSVRMYATRAWSCCGSSSFYLCAIPFALIGKLWQFIYRLQIIFN